MMYKNVIIGFLCSITLSQVAYGQIDGDRYQIIYSNENRVFLLDKKDGWVWRNVFCKDPEPGKPFATGPAGCWEMMTFLNGSPMDVNEIIKAKNTQKPVNAVK